MFSFYLHSIRNNLDTYVTPRSVTDAQAADLHRLLSANPSDVAVNVVANLGDPEATEYAAQLTNAITGGGWNAEFSELNPWEHSTVEDKGFHNIYLVLDKGLVIRTCIAGQPTNPDSKHPTPDAILESAFREAHIEVSGSGGSPDCGKYSLMVEVGRRPVAIGQQPSVLFRLGRWLMGPG